MSSSPWPVCCCFFVVVLSLHQDVMGQDIFYSILPVGPFSIIYATFLGHRPILRIVSPCFTRSYQTKPPFFVFCSTVELIHRLCFCFLSAKISNSKGTNTS